MWILPNILLTMLSARLGNFFEVWNTMVHARMPQKNAEWIFGWFSILVIFLPNFEDFKPIWQVARQWNEEFDFNSGIINDGSSCEPKSCHERPERKCNNSKQGKKSVKLKTSLKLNMHISKASLHIPWCFIPQKNSQASLITWLKGYLVIFTYDREISKQSWGGNCGTPCSHVS